jgi:hypothetical protein
VSKPVTYTNSGESQHATIEGELLRRPVGTTGVLIDGTTAHYGPVRNPAPNTLVQWSPNGYKSFDKNYWHHTQTPALGGWFATSPGVVSKPSAADSRSAVGGVCGRRAVDVYEGEVLRLGRRDVSAVRVPPASRVVGADLAA